MRGAWAVVVAVFLAAWLVGSVVHQSPPRWWWTVARFDRFRLLPQWSFFAPRPGRRDHHLLVRDFVGDIPTDWREIDTGCSPAITRWFINPDRYRQKALTDLVNSLLTARRMVKEQGGDAATEKLSLPYLAILTWVAAQPVAQRPCLRQFAVVSSAGHGIQRKLEVVYLSEPHRLEEEWCSSGL